MTEIVGRAGTERVLRFVLELKPEDLPAEVRHQAKRCLLDGLGSLIAGTQTPVARIMADFAANAFRGDEASILIDGRKVSAVGAALANGFAANALDIDDGFRLVKGHPGACVLPVVLAAAEIASRPVHGRELLAALVVGYEVAIRAGLIRHARYATYHASGSWGAVAGAAAAGRLLGLGQAQVRHAMGAAEYHAPIAPMMKGIAKPSMVKDGIGWGAMVAVASALLAREGFTGIEPLFADSPETGWIANLGTDYGMLGLYFKPYAACRWAQPAVAGALKVVRENALDLRQVTCIRIRTFEAAAALNCTPPADTEQAQYNLAFPVAAALLDGEVGPAQVLPPRLRDPRLVALAGKVRVETAEEYEALFPRKTVAEVVAATIDGREFSSGPMEPRWEPPADLPSDGELEAKFLWLAGPVLGEPASHRLARAVWRLEEPDAVRRIVSACLPGS